ncbi:MAG TPA: glycosyltransferase family 2 protein [Pirellulaceae bacterium]|jgi:glycosyltransferase involved in cell wall biosynthesis|nr:glycosyltransferase family 2 protein [Pirellulaceae bacterium]
MTGEGPTNPQPEVTIGLPVYNGERRLPHALTSLLSFSGPSFQIVVVDNASTDRTGEIAADFARRDARVRYVRNDRNIGALPNFLRTLELAESPFFMWASDDDAWQANYLAELHAALTARPDAVLATAAAIHWSAEGAYVGRIETAAPEGSREARLKSLFRQNASCWIYGLYRTDWLRGEAARLAEYPLFGADVIWLATTVLSQEVVGSDRTAIFKRQRPGGAYYQTDEQGFRLWRAFAATASRELPKYAENARMARLARREMQGLVYRSYVRRSNPLKALARPFELGRHFLKQQFGMPIREADLFAHRTGAGLQS